MALRIADLKMTQIPEAAETAQMSVRRDHAAFPNALAPRPVYPR
jgi:hypothetical protein